MAVVAMKQLSTDKVDNGIKAPARKALAQKLGEALGSTYALYLKTQFYHWNVTGPNFQALHLMFETQYNELALANDTIAERIRALGYVAPGTLQSFKTLSAIAEDKECPEKAEAMLKNLHAAHEVLIKSWRSLAKQAGEAQDEVTLGLASERLAWHEKTAWMLRSSMSQ